MVITVNRDVTMRGAEDNRLIADASALGLRPGEWPDRIIVLGHVGGSFDRSVNITQGTDLVGVIYRSACKSWVLTVIND